MKKPQSSSFKLNPIAAAIAIAMASQFSTNVALAGSGFGSGVTIKNQPVTVPTYYANSPVGNVPALDSATGAPVVNPLTGKAIDPATGHPYVVNSGKALRKFVDTLPGIPGITSFGANNLGQYIPLAVPEKNWVNPVTGVVTTDDYYEIAAVEFNEKMHSDLPKATHLRGYVQLETAGNAATSKHIALTYPNGSPILDSKGVQVYAYDNPHHLGPLISSTKGTAVRVKFTNYLPVGGKLFVPVDTTITGAGLGPDGKTSYTQNRAEIHLVGGQSPWISAGTPHQWVAPAGEVAAYAAGLGKGASAQSLPDMLDPGNGSTTLFFPNDMSARFMFYQDRTSGLTRLNSYVGLEAGYVVTDPIEQTLVSGGTIGGLPVAAGTVPADQIPLIIEDKTFVPQNIAQQDAKWDTAIWGQPGDLWFPHMYETNQDPNSLSGANPVGRWDYGPLFWPIFTVDPTKAVLPTPSFTPEAYMDTPVINGTAYPTLTVDPKAYRFRILNASNDRYINLGLYKADPAVTAPQLDINGNPVFDASGAQLVMTNTEVKMVPATPIDTIGSPPGWDTVNNVQLPLPQYPNLPWNINAEPSGPTRAWPVDGRAGGTPDPTTSGPDFVVIGNDGGLLPHVVDIPSQPVTYEANRRSITIGNIYGYGMLLGPAERADAIVDFTAYAGQTLILYNDAPAPTPFNDPRNDYYTGDPDQTSTGGAYSTLPGYGPNTRTMMQIKVNATNLSGTGGPLNAVALAAALPAAYGASQPTPTVPAVAYNAAFNTNDTDIYAHVATGSLAQPTLDFSTSAGGVAIPNTGTGSGYDPANPPTVVFNNTVNGTSCLSPVGVSAFATAVVDPVTLQVTGFQNFNGGAGYICAPTVTFTNPPGTNGVGAQAEVLTNNLQSITVQAKAEQELFDDYGRYNSTGGVELPLVNAIAQTTVPLNYIDSPTEIIGDNEAQIWKLVDNGFWSNSIHFDQVDVQLVNRVGWDGTVKAPATNEVGWKDTLRLNPLEDVIVAVRAKRPTIPFGLPASSRLMDPSKKLGTTGKAASGLGFTTAAGVTPALLASNTKVSYDNEFTWNSAILGHSEDDFTRPVVFHPLVVKPSAPTITGGTAGSLTWTDTTPAADPATLANPQNEIGFRILRASYKANGTLNLPYAQIGNMPANATSYTDATQVAGTDYSYEVVAWNNAGSATSAPYSEITAPAVPTWPAAGSVVVNNNGTVTLKWNTVAGATQYIVTANGVAQTPIAAGGGATQTATVTLAVGSVYSITVTAQKVKLGLTAKSAASTPVSADMTLPNTPAAPAASNATATGMTVNWSTVTTASGAAITGYTLQYSTNGGASWTNVSTNSGVKTTAASLVAASTSAVITGMASNTSYTFQLRATGTAGNGAYSAASAAQFTLPVATAANGSNGAPVTGGLNWTTVAGQTYTVNWTGPATGSKTSAISGQQLTFTTGGTYSMTLTVTYANGTNASGNTATSAAVSVTVK